MKLHNTLTDYTYEAALTTEHAASSYGVPVLVDTTTGDAVDQFSVSFTEVIEATDDELRDLAAAGYKWQSTPRDGVLLNGWAVEAGQLVAPDGRAYEPHEAVTADEVAQALGVPTEVTLWFNQAGSVPAEDVVREADFYLARARAAAEREGE